MERNKFSYKSSKYLPNLMGTFPTPGSIELNSDILDFSSKQIYIYIYIYVFFLPWFCTEFDLYVTRYHIFSPRRLTFSLGPQNNSLVFCCRASVKPQRKCLHSSISAKEMHSCVSVRCCFGHLFVLVAYYLGCVISPVCYNGLHCDI